MKVGGIYPAGNSLVIAIPADYVKKLGWGLREKVVIHLEEENKSIRIRALKSLMTGKVQYEQSEK